MAETFVMKTLCNKGILNPLHQAICSTLNPVSRKVILVLIEQFPNDLDLNALVGACENPRLSRGSIELILDRLSTETYKAVQKNVEKFASMAVKRKNVCIIQIFIERFPTILNSGNILAHACTYGTAEMVDNILSAGLRKNIGRAGGLFRKVNNREDTLDIAIRLYNEKDDERRYILRTCLKYANAAKMCMPTPNPDYPVLLTAIGLVPHHVLESFLKLYAHEIRNINITGKHAIFKAIHMTSRDNKNGELPSIFKSRILIDACNNKKLEVVQQLLEKNAFETGLLSMNSTNNALDVAIDQFDENDNTSCDILRICLQYANAAKLGMRAPPSNYPTVLAAVGLVPDQMFVTLIKKYYNEIRNVDRKEKLALKKVFRMKHDEDKYANRLDMRCQYPLSINTRRLKLKGSLASIPSERNLLALCCV